MKANTCVQVMPTLRGEAHFFDDGVHLGHPQHYQMSHASYLDLLGRCGQLGRPLPIWQ